ncbi:hypothetical protein PBI_SHIBA_78 [Arthrobacter phage Shiba]|nr:hypothetical protein PBI_SHIBA_78 [Arthrobacter phage Shiba]
MAYKNNRPHTATAWEASSKMGWSWWLLWVVLIILPFYMIYLAFVLDWKALIFSAFFAFFWLAVTVRMGRMLGEHGFNPENENKTDG